MRVKLERLKPNEPRKNLLGTLESQDSICDLIGQSLVMEAKEVEAERSALEDIYNDCKEDTERSLCLVSSIWSSNNINDYMIRTKLHDFGELIRLEVLRHLSPLPTDDHQIFDINRTENCVRRLRQALKRSIEYTNIKIAYLRSAIDLESDVRERALQFNLQNARDSLAFKDLLSSALEMVKNNSTKIIAGKASSLSSININHKDQKESSYSQHPTDPAIQDLLDQIDFLETPMTMRPASTEKSSIPTAASQLLASPSQPRPVILKPVPPPPSASRTTISPRRIIGIESFKIRQIPSQPVSSGIDIRRTHYNHAARRLVSPKGG